MIRFIYGDELTQFPILAHHMFKDRAYQFRERLKWDVSVDQRGEERDQYDALNPLYVVFENSDGTHAGSMRFLPTTGRTMVNEHFAEALAGGAIRSPFIWECTRFCLSRNAGPHIAAALLQAGSVLMRKFMVKHFVGVFDAPMQRVYRMIGSSPDVVGSIGQGRGKISVGLWEYSENDLSALIERSGVSKELMERWFDQSFAIQRQGAADICYA